MSTVKRVTWTLSMVFVFSGVGLANWTDSFDGGQLTLSTWEFPALPDVAGTYKGTVLTDADGNGYLELKETTAFNLPSQMGAAFGAAFGSPEIFRDVRVGATLNVGGDASHNYYGLLARATYFIDPDGSLSGVAPGFWATCYIMHIDYHLGPANLALNLEKVVNNQNVMDRDVEVVIPRVENARSYYAELEVVGAGPVYVTGRLYESKGGALVAQTPTMIDTNAKDGWEDPGDHEPIFAEGVSGVFAQNEDPEPVGFVTTWDDISSVSDGPSAALVSPAQNAANVSMQAHLRWVEGRFATGRQLWFGTPGNLQLVDPAPTGANYVTDLLEPDQTYQWRVDQIGPGGTVTGHLWQFTTGNAWTIEDFESYAHTAAIAAAWPHNLPDYDYVFQETGTVAEGAKAMALVLENQYEPYFTEATRSFAVPQDWTLGNPDHLSISYRGEHENVEQLIYVKVEDAAGKVALVDHPLPYAIQTDYWRTWDIDLTELAELDLTGVAKLTIGVGSGTTTGQPDAAEDTLYLDNIRLSVTR